MYTKEYWKAVLVGLFVLLTLTACGDSGTGETTADTTVTGDGTANVETEETEVTDDLPSDLDYGGANFAFYTRQKDFFHSPIHIEESSGEQLNDALYDRSCAIEERLGVVFEETLDTGDVSKAKSMILAGDDTYKVVTARCVHTIQFAAEGLARHLDELTYLDLSKPYWNGAINENLTMAGNVITTVGDYNLSAYDFTHVLLFNKNLTDDLQLESPYTLVKEGKWTFDNFRIYGETATVDTNGDGTMDKSDQYGLVSSAKQIPPCFWIAAGVQGMNKDDTDIPRYTMSADEHFLNTLLEIYELTWDTGLWYPEKGTDNIPQSSIDLFSQEQALMMDATFFHVEAFRDMEADFGILPFPKYDETQEKYLSRIEGCELPFVPSNLSAEDADMAGAVLEALSSYSRQNVTPVYYETYLKSKNTRDSESAEMLDIVFADRVFDLSDTIWCDDIRDKFIFNCFVANNRNIVSQITSNEPTVQKSIDKVVNGFLGE